MALDLALPKRERTRNDLIEAADRVFRRRGIDGTIVRHITVAARVAHGTFYNYFDSIDELVEAMVRARLLLVAAHVEDLRQQIPQGDLALAVGARSLFREIGASTARNWLLQRPEVLARVLADTIQPFAVQDIGRLVSQGRASLPCAPVYWLSATTWAMIGLLREGADGASDPQTEDAFLALVLSSLGLRGTTSVRLSRASRKHLERDT